MAVRGCLDDGEVVSENEGKAGGDVRSCHRACLPRKTATILARPVDFHTNRCRRLALRSHAFCTLCRRWRCCLARMPVSCRVSLEESLADQSVKFPREKPFTGCRWLVARHGFRPESLWVRLIFPHTFFQYCASVRRIARCQIERSCSVVTHAMVIAAIPRWRVRSAGLPSAATLNASAHRDFLGRDNGIGQG
jgi:hypothetical protein